MKDQILRAIFMVLFFGAAFCVDLLRKWVTSMGVSDVAQMVVVATICLGLPALGCIAVLTGLWKPGGSQQPPVTPQR